ncbi:MAG TPA: hypothetical protein VN224_06375, partial [Xanthomonadales bacterium]|nr:hypothetical protein [Xanthomonadales bacterium]
MELRRYFAAIAAVALVAVSAQPRIYAHGGEPSTKHAPPRYARGPHVVWSKKMKFANAKDVADILRAAFGPDFYATG